MKRSQFLLVILVFCCCVKDSIECEPGDELCRCSVVGDSRLCLCPVGFRLAADKIHCLDVDECLLNNGHGSCQDACNNTFGGYSCSCTLPGTRLSTNNHTCEDIDECEDENFLCSHICINTFGSAFCACPQGFILGEDWRTCVDINECEVEEVLRECDGMCINTPGSYICKQHSSDTDKVITSQVNVTNCPDGFKIDANGKCVAEKTCSVNNGGCAHICNSYKNSTKCSCYKGFHVDKKNNSNCIEKTCPPITPRPFLNVECVDYRRKDNVFPAGAFCKMKCKRGYKLKGHRLLVCGENARWNGSVPYCKSPTCPALERLENGYILPSRCTKGFAYWGQHCYYTCQPGFSLSGQAINTCQKNSKWTLPNAPICRKNTRLTNCLRSYYGRWFCHTQYQITH